MKFIDEVKISAKAGDGGNGAVAWRREAGVPRGGPAGGDGGNGGDIIFRADAGLHSLLDYRYMSILKSKNGQKGQSKNKFGANSEDVICRVPVGTQIFDLDTDIKITDLTTHDQEEVVCKGGSGGFGNTRFKSSTRQAPDFANSGLDGEEKNLKLSLKLMADVGLLGFPNAGKSTLLSRLSAAKPKIANYPFTTLKPQLGVVKMGDYQSFVMADIPGLIEGASEGVGLGFRFLKHLERVKILCHLIEPGPDAYQKYKLIRKELENFSEKLCELPEIIVLSKSDIGADSALENKSKFIKKNLEVCEISAVTGQGIDNLKAKLWEVLSTGLFLQKW